MSLQVGASCYATAVDAGRAACSQFQPLTSFNTTHVKSVTCTSSNPTTGTLNLNIVTTEISSGASSSVAVIQTLTYPPCVQSDYMEAAGIIFAALMAAYIVWFCGVKILSYLGWSRGDHA